MEFTCMNCGRKHARSAPLVDEHIRCGCGYRFYAFYKDRMAVTLPSNDIMSQAAVMAFRRFVISTGRCRDARIEPVDYTEFLRRADPLGLIEVGLERLQTEKYGKAKINSYDINSMVESIFRNLDVLMKNKKDEVEIVEIHRKPKGKRGPPFDGEPIAYLNEESRLNGWQKEIMERDQSRTGYLFGDAG